MTLVAICLAIPQCMRLSGTVEYGASKIMGSRPWPFWGHVTSSVTWPFD